MEVAEVKMLKECTFIHVIKVKKVFTICLVITEPARLLCSSNCVSPKLDAIVYLCIFSKDVDFLSVYKLRAFISRLNFARPSSLSTCKNVRVLGINSSASSKNTIGLDI